MKRPAAVVVTAILCLSALEALALHKGIDGAMFSLVTATIGGLAGYAVRPPRV